MVNESNKPNPINNSKFIKILFERSFPYIFSDLDSFNSISWFRRLFPMLNTFILVGG